MKTLFITVTLLCACMVQAQVTLELGVGVINQRGLPTVTLKGGYEAPHLTALIGYVTPLTRDYDIAQLFTMEVGTTFSTANYWGFSPRVGYAFHDYSEAKYADQHFAFIWSGVVTSPVIYDGVRWKSEVSYTSSMLYVGTGFTKTFYKKE